MASDVTSPDPVGGELVPADSSPTAAPEPPPEFVGTPHWPRFFAIYALLGGALFAGIVLAVVFGTRTVSPGQPWSAWRPSGGGIGELTDIAKHVGAEYRLPNGNQLVDVIAKAPAVTAAGQTIPVGYIALRGTGGAPDQVFTLSKSDSVMYTLCGLGSSCSIASGQPSVARGRLVRREILELALYTFHYDSAIDNVIAVMPPISGSANSPVVFLQRRDLASHLRTPLAQLLAPHAPSPATIAPREAALVDGTTGKRAYSFTLQRAQDGNAILILTRLKA